MGTPNKFNKEMKERLIELRSSGLGNKRIAKELGVSNSTVVLWLRKLGLNGRLKEYKPADRSETRIVKVILCKQCGGRYETKRHTTKFCSDKCRRKYNGKHRGHKQTCEQCGKEFKDYKTKRFCSNGCQETHRTKLQIERDIKKEKEQKEKEIIKLILIYSQ